MALVPSPRCAWEPQATLKPGPAPLARGQYSDCPAVQPRHRTPSVHGDNNSRKRFTITRDLHEAAGQ
jgi:hypothetical protein